VNQRSHNFSIRLPPSITITDANHLWKWATSAVSSAPDGPMSVCGHVQPLVGAWLAA